MIYLCDPEKNKKCPKTACFIFSGPCENTTNEQFARLDEDDEPIMVPEWPKINPALKEENHE